MRFKDAFAPLSVGERTLLCLYYGLVLLGLPVAIVLLVTGRDALHTTGIFLLVLTTLLYPVPLGTVLSRRAKARQERREPSAPTR